MPLLPEDPAKRTSTFSSKFLSIPPRQMRNVLSETTFWRALRDNYSVLDAPEHGIAVPAIQRDAVEERHESHRVVRSWWWPSTRPTAARRAGLCLLRRRNVAQQQQRCNDCAHIGRCAFHQYRSIGNPNAQIVPSLVATCTCPRLVHGDPTTAPVSVVPLVHNDLPVVASSA